MRGGVAFPQAGDQGVLECVRQGAVADAFRQSVQGIGKVRGVNQFSGQRPRYGVRVLAVFDLPSKLSVGAWNDVSVGGG